MKVTLHVWGDHALAIGERPNTKIARAHSAEKETERRYNVVVALNHEQIAAAEGWRSAHGINTQAEALGELIKLGLLSEIAKIYRLVCDNRSTEPRGEGKNF